MEVACIGRFKALYHRLKIAEESQEAAGRSGIEGRRNGGSGPQRAAANNPANSSVVLPYMFNK